MKWVMLLVVYGAPPNAVDWDGPWKPWLSQVKEERFYDSEAECRNEAIQLIGKMHEGMLAPIRSRCIAIEEMLPKGAPR